jgi:hypothetical protein
MHFKPHHHEAKAVSVAHGFACVQGLERVGRTKSDGSVSPL